MDELMGLGANLDSIVVEDPRGEYELAIQGVAVGGAVMEMGLLRLWRLKVTDRWVHILDDDGQPMYTSWNDVVMSFCERSGVSRSKVYSRMRVYSTLHHLGYTLPEMKDLMSRSPYKVTAILGKLVKWDSRADKPAEMLAEPEEIREIVESSDAYGSVEDVANHVSVDVLGKPKISMAVTENMEDLVLDVELNGELFSLVYTLDRSMSSLPDDIGEVMNGFRSKYRVKVVDPQEVSGW